MDAPGILLSVRTTETHLGYRPIPTWFRRNLAVPTLKTQLPDGEVVVENNNIVRYGGKRYRRWSHHVEDAQNPFKTREVAIPEKKGLVRVLAETPKTEAGLRTLVDAGTPYLTKGRRRGASIYTATVEVLAMEKRRVCYFSVHDLPAQILTDRRGEMDRVQRRTEIRVSPVRTAQQTERLCVSQVYSIPGYREFRNRTGIVFLHYLADGTQTDLGDAADDTELWRQWWNQCDLDWVVVKTMEKRRNGDLIYDSEMGAHRETRVMLDVPPEAFSTKADRVVSDNAEFERVMEARREFKEALAAAVFHPIRVERMTETYGEDWMERV